MAISSQRNNLEDRLFAKTKNSSLGFVFWLMLSLLLMFADYHYRYLHVLRHGFSYLVSPLQYLVDYPVRVIGWVQSVMTTKAALVDENMQLHSQHILLEAELQKLTAIKEENSELKGLLLTAASTKIKAMAAQILAVDTSTSRQLIVLNKGKRDGVYVGQPVLDAKGVVGQIIDIGSMTSTVMLISDSKSAVPVQNSRTGERGILAGENHLNQLALINLPDTSLIKKDDLLVTSGLGRLYPEGYPVGRVTHVTTVAGEAFLKVAVEPIALLNKTRLVLLIWPDKEQIELSQEVQERMRELEAQA